MHHCLQCAGLLVPLVLQVALKGHKLAMLATHLQDSWIQHAIPHMQIRAGEVLKKKSELAASTLPSRGSKSGRKCYITPAFSGIPKQKGTKSELAASPLPS